MRFGESRKKTKVPAGFPALYEVHNLKKFQSEGHFVPALRERTADGQTTMQPRKWKGTQVHCLTLLGPDGEPAKYLDVQGKEMSLCRVVSDSRANAELMFERVMRDTFWANRKALEIVSFNAVQLAKCSDERTRLLNYLLTRAPREEVAKLIGSKPDDIAEVIAAESDADMRAAVNAKLAGSQHGY